MKTKRILLLLISLGMVSIALSEEPKASGQQGEPHYSALKTGLALRSEPSDKAPVLAKIPYGEPLSILPSEDDRKSISVDGFDGEWWKVKYKNQTGFIISSYTLPVAPPKTGTASMVEYLSQISSPASPTVAVHHGSGHTKYDSTTQLYKNGMMACTDKGRESSGESYVLPHFTIDEGFLLMRLLGKGGCSLIGEDEVLPKESAVRTDKVKITVTRFPDTSGNPGRVERINYTSEEAGYYEFEISTTVLGIIVSWGGGA